jgi:hypothetical protein
VLRFLREKVLRKMREAHHLAVQAGRDRESVGVQGFLEDFGRWERPSFFYGKFMESRVLGGVYSGGVGWGREARDACNQRRE